LLPEIKAYMAKARLRRGIEIIKLANRIEALKMQEDDTDDIPDVMADVPSDSKAAAGAALSGQDAGSSKEVPAATAAPAGKRSLSKIAKGAIFREVVLAKVREMKESEKRLQVEKDAQDKAAKRKSFQSEQ
jgi:calcium/calmodulin-dependent protein kinase I